MTDTTTLQNLQLANSTVNRKELTTVIANKIATLRLSTEPIAPYPDSDKVDTNLTAMLQCKHRNCYLRASYIRFNGCIIVDVHFHCQGDEVSENPLTRIVDATVQRRIYGNTADGAVFVDISNALGDLERDVNAAWGVRTDAAPQHSY